MLIDATNQIVGRLCSLVAKNAMLGEQIVIINSEKAIISGKRAVILDRFSNNCVARGTWKKGPFYIRSPDMLLKRLIRGMLPYKKARGSSAYKNITCWIGVPAEFKDKKAISFKEADGSKLTIDCTSLGDISKHIGGKVD